MIKHQTYILHFSTCRVFANFLEFLTATRFKTHGPRYKTQSETHLFVQKPESLVPHKGILDRAFSDGLDFKMTSSSDIDDARSFSRRDGQISRFAQSMQK